MIIHRFVNLYKLIPAFALSLLLLAVLLVLASLGFHPSVAGVPNIRYFRKYWQQPIFC
jgi:hypothetical protein